MKFVFSSQFQDAMQPLKQKTHPRFQIRIKSGIFLSKRSNGADAFYNLGDVDIWISSQGANKKSNVPNSKRSKLGWFYIFIFWKIYTMIPHRIPWCICSFLLEIRPYRSRKYWRIHVDPSGSRTFLTFTVGKFTCVSFWERVYFSSLQNVFPKRSNQIIK